MLGIAMGMGYLGVRVFLDSSGVVDIGLPQPVATHVREAKSAECLNACQRSTG